MKIIQKIARGYILTLGMLSIAFITLILCDIIGIVGILPIILFLISIYANDLVTPYCDKAKNDMDEVNKS